MHTTVGIAALVLGLVGFGGQLLSVISWPLAQRLGLQEKDEDSEALFRRLERHTAIWDIATWWTLPLAGVAMLLTHPWWPLIALFAGGIM